MNKQAPTKNAIRKRSRKLYVLNKEKQSCVKCGSEEKVEVHHEDYRDEHAIVFLCQKCHIQHHLKNKTWGRKRKYPKEKKCVVCGVIFTHGREFKKTCSKECLSKAGKLNANKRWGGINDTRRNKNTKSIYLLV